MRLAAAITRFTRVGADAGAITRPFTSWAVSGGGGWGTKVAPPVLGGTWAWAAGAPATTPARHAPSMAARSSLFGEAVGILFRTPTGLADGLALKELARLREGGSPQWFAPPWFPRSVPPDGFGVRGKLADVRAASTAFSRSA